MSQPGSGWLVLNRPVTVIKRLMKLSSLGPGSWHLFKSASLAAIVFALLGSRVLAGGSEIGSADRVELTSGLIEGLKQQDRLRIFKGIPWANLQARNGKGKAFLYYFDYPKLGGAGHGAEVAYVFGNLDGFLRPGSSAMNVSLSDTIMSYWINFAKHGDPNGPNLPTWPAFSVQTNNTMILRSTPQAERTPNLEGLRAFDDYWGQVREKRE